MSRFYRIHFASSKTSKRYPQALKLAALAHHHEMHVDGPCCWHTVIFTEQQVDLMAAFYNLKVHLLKTKPFQFKSRAWFGDIYKVAEKLRQEGYLDRGYYNKEGEYVLIRATRTPREYVESYREIKELIRIGDFEKAVGKYYDALGDEYLDPLHDELIYLKRLADMPLAGRDLLHFCPESSRSDLVKANMREYCHLIDALLLEREQMGLKSLLGILKENAPTMQELIARARERSKRAVYVEDGVLVREEPVKITEGCFSAQYDDCPRGRLFSKYPDQVRHCRIVEIPQDNRYLGLWCRYSPGFYEKEILNKGFLLRRIDAYQHKRATRVRGRLEPDVTTVCSFGDIAKESFATEGIHYTGRAHSIEGITLYEIDLVRGDPDRGKVLGNPFLEAVEEILRESENRLREKHGLPRIGEGWISEVQMFHLVRSVYGDAELHASPEWIKPQHFDIYVPSKELAFEYQGRQHFEPVDFFGGEIGLAALRERDLRKRAICKRHKVILVEWRYDEPLEHDVLVRKLMAVDVFPCENG